MSRLSFLGSLVLCTVVAACESGGGSGGEAKSSAGSAEGAEVAGSAAKPAGGGFAADLAKDLGGGEGSGEGSGSGAGSGAGASEASGSASAEGSGSAKPEAVAKPEPEAKPEAVAKPEPGAKPEPETKPEPVAKPEPVVADNGKKKTPMTAELAAIQLSLLPNWKRDVVDGGTISLAVDAPKGNVTFVFQYGIEDASAPTDRDAYKKWLADNKRMMVKDDRQRGSTWYLEGTDGSGRPMFRFIAAFGPKKLLCGGSLYKNSGLGDLRDEVIQQAKKICETVAL